MGVPIENRKISPLELAEKQRKYKGKLTALGEEVEYRETSTISSDTEQRSL